MQFINSPAAKAANLPFSQAVRVGDVLYLSGCLGNVQGKLELVPGGMEAEARQTMENIGARRLQTVMERILEEISFSAPDSVAIMLRCDASSRSRRAIGRM